MDAITCAEADQILANHLTALPAERVAFDSANGRVLQESILADRDFPPYDRVMMDGIAIRFSDWNGTPLTSGGVQRAGVPAMTLNGPGTCLEVMTGAVLPVGADTVIPVEELVESDGGISLRAGYQPKPGQFVHTQGSDNRRGDLLLPPGTVLSAKEIAVLATCGYSQVLVTAIPRVTIVSTGDELVSVDEAPGPFQIRKSNSYALAAACQSLDTPVKVTLDHLPDDRTVIAARLGELLNASDLLLLSGGISKGKYDFLQELLIEAGATKHFQWVKQRPGKPLWFGTTDSGTAVLALPGNPNSTLTCFYRYAVQSIHILAGMAKKVPRQVSLKSPFTFSSSLTLFLPVTCSDSRSGNLEVEPLPPQNSGDLSRLALSDGFIELPGDQIEFPVGFVASFYPW